MEVGRRRVLDHLDLSPGEEPRWIGGSDGRTDIVQVGRLVYKVFLFEGDEPDREAGALQLLDGSAVPAPQLLSRGQFPEGERWLSMTKLPGEPFRMDGGWATTRGLRFYQHQGWLAGLIQTSATPPGFGHWMSDPKESLSESALP